MPSNMDKLVWVVGTKSINADKFIPWTETDLPNFSDPEILIIDLNSRNTNILSKSRKVAAQLRYELEAKLSSGGTVIFITSKKNALTVNDIVKLSSGNTTSPRLITNYDVCPSGVNVKNVPLGNVIRYNEQTNPFTKYLSNVRHFEFFLTLYLGQSFQPVLDYDITDNNCNILGRTFLFKQNDKGNQGTIIFLPPPTEISVEESIDLLLEVYGSAKKESTLPSWVTTNTLKPVTDIQHNIAILSKKFRNIEAEIKKKRIEEQKALMWYKLLTGRDNDLNTVVHDAFKLLGIKVYYRRAKNLEDGVFKVSSPSSTKYGILEIKGSNKGTTLGDMRQCDNWVQDYYEFGKGKGIFIPNQFRLKEYPASKSARLGFEPNQVQYAQDRKMCVLPSCVLFDAVQEILNGDKTPDKAVLQKTILETDGILTKLL